MSAGPSCCLNQMLTSRALPEHPVYTCVPQQTCLGFFCLFFIVLTTFWITIFCLSAHSNPSTLQLKECDEARDFLSVLFIAVSPAL